ncbi:MAG: hypothetical protein KGJ80_21830, partial [Chloroflexota bacterium]|nr:hypothetical protein [Chloroflexota bacterium]
MPESVTVFLFVKGTAASAVEQMVADARLAASLDTLERVRGIPEVGAIVVATANREFAARAATLGAQVEIDPPGEFHWGRRIAALVDRYHAAVPLYVGGGSGALMTQDDWRAVARRALRGQNLVVTNNYYSCDFAAWSPGSALHQIEPPELDNDLAFRLGERAGMEIIALPKNAATQLDLDTPTDLMTVSFHPGVGAHLRDCVNAAHLDTLRADKLLARLRERGATLLIAGRVPSSLALLLERETRCQWRIFSEERGMRASGRAARGEARSLLGYFMEQAGTRDFFAALARLADAAVIDSRVLFAHGRSLPPASDRFNSDLLRPESVANPFVREFTLAARDAAIPVLLGGHSLVSGGMYALVEAATA